MASIISAGTTSGTALNMTADTSGQLQLATGSSATTALTIDTSQRAAFVAGTAALPAITTTGDTDTGIWFPAANTIAASTSGTEAMRIDSSGNVLVGKTTTATTALGWNLSPVAGNAKFDAGQYFVFNRDTNDILINFRRSDTSVGNINVTTTATAYVTSSDYRLKENIAPMTGALDTVAQLKPVTYKWKIDGSDGQGFIAHELQAVVPDCVSGEKDAVDEDGSIKPQGVDTSFLVATLTAAIQEQNQIINDLKARIETLESK
jgi:hypothetical protein